MSHQDYEQRVKRVVPGIFHMISGSEDSQVSMEAYNVGKFELPNPAGKSGGACTAALLQTLYKDEEDVGELSWVDVLRTMRGVLRDMGYDQIPHLTSSRTIEMDTPMRIVPEGCRGNKRALLIAINYVGQEGELGACHNDLKNIKNYLTQVQGFKDRDMLILMDDGSHHMPTKSNIMRAFEKMVEYSKPGDVAWISYSGHGGRARDRDGDEEDGYDETLIPVDYKSAGQIVDDDILKTLIKPMSGGVTTTILMDCCHSGTVMDLPFVLGSEDDSMRIEKKFDMTRVRPKKGNNSQQKRQNRKSSKPESFEIV